MTYNQYKCHGLQAGCVGGRVARVRLSAGVNTVKIPFVSSLLNQKTLQVGVSNLDVSLGSVKVDFEMPQQKALAAVCDSLSSRMKLINDSLSLLASLTGVYEAERAMLLKNNDVGGDKGFSDARLRDVAVIFRCSIFTLL